jgi:hypothetical protein
MHRSILSGLDAPVMLYSAVDGRLMVGEHIELTGRDATRANEGFGRPFPYLGAGYRLIGIQGEPSCAVDDGVRPKLAGELAEAVRNRSRFVVGGWRIGGSRQAAAAEKRGGLGNFSRRKVRKSWRAVGCACR